MLGPQNNEDMLDWGLNKANDHWNYSILCVRWSLWTCCIVTSGGVQHCRCWAHLGSHINFVGTKGGQEPNQSDRDAIFVDLGKCSKHDNFCKGGQIFKNWFYHVKTQTKRTYTLLRIKSIKISWELYYMLCSIRRDNNSFTQCWRSLFLSFWTEFGSILGSFSIFWHPVGRMGCS